MLGGSCPRASRPSWPSAATRASTKRTRSSSTKRASTAWGTVTAILTFKSDVRRGGPVIHECFGQPPKDCVGMRGDADYSHLEADGLPAVGTAVKPGDAVVGRYMPAIGDEPPRDRSVVLRKNEAGIVDAALRTVNRDGLPMAVVRIRQRRKPEIGDKFSSRHGQKG